MEGSLEGMARVRMASCAPTATGARAAPSGPSSAGITGTASGETWLWAASPHHILVYLNCYSIENCITKDSTN